MAEHTPGPWAARFVYRMIRRVRQSPGDLLIAAPPENDWGDACLMAASPDLLSALKQCEIILARQDTLRHVDPDFPALDAARAAIARAEGRTDAR